MEEPQYHYRGRGQIGNPDSTIHEDVQLSVATGAGDGGVRFELRSEQFPAGRLTLTPEQVDHLVGVLEGTVTGDAAAERPTEGVVHPDGHVDPDGWDALR